MNIKMKCIGIREPTYSEEIHYDFKADLTIHHGFMADNVNMTFTVFGQPDQFEYGKSYTFLLTQN